MMFRQKSRKMIQTARKASSSEPKAKNSSYAARVSLDRTQIQLMGRLPISRLAWRSLSRSKPGLAAVITYLLSPLIRYTHDSMHER